VVAVVVADPTVTVGSVVGAGDLKNYWVLLGVVLVEKLQGVPVGAFVVDCFQPKGCPELQSAAGAVLVVVVVAVVVCFAPGENWERHLLENLYFVVVVVVVGSKAVVSVYIAASFAETEDDSSSPAFVVESTRLITLVSTLVKIPCVAGVGVVVVGPAGPSD